MDFAIFNLVIKMNLYYKKGILFIEFQKGLKEKEFLDYKEKIFRIIHEYGIDSIIIESSSLFFSNQEFLQKMKRDYYAKYHGNFFVH